MLTQLHIRDFAIVDTLSLELAPGMTVLTGETGAGKSILLDALGLALGDRADSGAVRPGAARAEIDVGFLLEDCPAARRWLEEQGLDEGDECLLRRVVGADGRSRAFVNGRPVPVQSLRSLGELLVDIQGQHAHQALLRREAQREALDAYGGHGELCAAVAAAFRRWDELRRRRADLEAHGAARRARLELLRYQVQELEAAAPREDEFPALEEEHRRLANLESLRSGAQEALYRLDEDAEQALGDALARLAAQMEGLAATDAGLAAAAGLLGEAAVQVREAASELRHYLDALSDEPGRLAQVEGRLGQLTDLARKHQVDPAALSQHLEALRAELEELAAQEDQQEHMDEALAEAEAAYRQAAQALGAARRHAAETLAAEVTGRLEHLAMPHARLDIALEPADAPGPHGDETVAFLVSTNPGQAPRPLAKVASGGELSRIGLALQVATAATAAIPTLVFDEVDVGIGGGTAEVVGRLLRTLAQRRQVLCVTHQPQVAAQARHHLQVSKSSRGSETRAAVHVLSGPARVEELARMLGGVEITEQTRRHAREMLERASAAEAPAAG